MQKQTAVTAYFSSKQLLLFAFALQNVAWLLVIYLWYQRDQIK